MNLSWLFFLREKVFVPCFSFLMTKPYMMTIDPHDVTNKSHKKAIIAVCVKMIAK